MTKRIEVSLPHVARVEGHGNIHVRVEDGRVVEARWDIVETPRFFEVMLKGRHFSQAPMLVSRICGICSISHALATIRATERAFGVVVPPDAEELRRLAMYGEALQSHHLHLLFLGAPDFLGLPSVLPLVQNRPEVIQLALRLRGAANRLCTLVAGRSTHPVSLRVGGVTRMPERDALGEVRAELARSEADLEAVVTMFEGFEIPDFERETEFVALKGEGRYPSLGGRLVSTDGVEREEDQYREMTHEYVEPGNTSKWTRLSRPSFAVGALARFNLHHDLLHPRAAETAERLGLRAVDHNPFHNHLAQLVECVHVTHEAGEVLDRWLERTPQELYVDVEPRAGTGVGAVEAPRGILYHELTYDDQGRIERADCVIPTTQNNANIHLDLHALAAHYASRGVTSAELERLCAMLVRAYDPCISCSVH